MAGRWIGALAAIGVALGLGIAPTRAAAPWLPELTDRAIRAGADAMLPPIMSVVLGIASREQATPVRQLVARADDRVHTFNVCVDDHAKLVLTTVDERSRATTAFLLSTRGKLRKAISYAPGQPAELLSAKAAQPAFGRELDFWSRQRKP